MRHGAKPAAPGGVLLGFSITLFVLSLGFALAMPAFQRAERRSRANATLADLKTYITAFQSYAHEHGDWPADSAAPGDYPAGMAAALAPTHWQQRTPLGGHYVWLASTMQRGERIRAAVGLASVANNRVSDEKQQLGLLLQLATTAGIDPERLKLGFMNEPIYVLEH